MRLDDYCCLGRTVPEDSKRYGRKVCTAGYSEELRSFVRVYPLPIQSPMRQRSVSVLELSRNGQDSRVESWRLERERADAGIVAVKGEKTRDAVINWLADRVSPSIAALNAARASLGVIRPLGLRRYFRSAGEIVDPSQGWLFKDLDDSFGRGAIKLAPYLRFGDEAGQHDLQLREWGCYEWLRKEPERPEQLWENLRLADSGRETFLFVGNMCNRRNVWLVISVYSRSVEPSLFDALA